MTEMLNKEFSRKTFVKGGGALVVGFSVIGAGVAGKAAAAAPSEAGYNPPLTRLDSWIRINADNTVNVLTSQGDPGNGISTGFLMVAAEELDMDMSQMINGSSTHSNGQALNTQNDTWQVALTGGIGGSNSMSSTGHRIRAAAVAARAELLKLASAKLNTPVSNLSVSKGVVSGGGGSVTYGELLGGKLFNVTLTTTSLQHGVAPAKPVSQYKLVGTAAPRIDIPAEDLGQVRLLAQRRAARDAARPLGAAGAGPVADGRLREAADGRRKLDQAPSERAGRPAGRLRRRGRPGRVPGRPGGRAAQGHVGRVRRSCRVTRTCGRLP